MIEILRSRVELMNNCIGDMKNRMLVRDWKHVVEVIEDVRVVGERNSSLYS